MINKDATFILSLDVEMAWGSWRSGSYDWEAFSAEPSVCAELDQLAIELGTPFTFGLVGAIEYLNADVLSPFADSDLIDVTCPPLAGNYGADQLPTVGAVSRGLEYWASSGLSDRIRRSPVGHEVCSHSFFHAIPTSPEALVRDVEESRSVIGPFDSLIFPRDDLKLVSALSKARILQYRGTGEQSYMRTGKPSKAGKAIHLAEQSVGRPAPLSRYVAGNPGCLTTSAYLTLRTGIRRRIPRASIKRRFVQPLRNAVARGGNYHLWTHPWNLALPGSDGFDMLADIVSEAAKLQDRGDLRVVTMAQFAQMQAPPGDVRHHL